jgi:hypothetical protein
MRNQNAKPNPMKNTLATAGLLATLTLTGAALAATIPNPSFEANSFTVFPGYHHQAGNGAINGWTPSGGAGLNPAAGSPFADNGVVPNGSQVAFIQNGADSSMSTVISGLSAGTVYKVNFRVNARSGNTPNLKVDIDGINLLNTAITAVGGTNPYKYFAFDFTASAESQTMTLRNDAGGDNTVVFDDFSIAASNSGWSYAAWNDDASSGVDGSKPYTHAYSFGSAVGTVINGITFTGIAGGNPAVASSFSTAGLPAVFNNDDNTLTGGSDQLANDFLYNGAVQSITISGLELGAEYVATIYSVGWENGTRAATFSVGEDRLTVNQDHFDDNKGIRFSYRYIATESSITLTYVPLQGNTIHTYGFSNYELNPPRPPEIANPSFEADTFTVFPGYVSGNGPITGWSALNGHGINPGTFGGPFSDNGTIPNGTKTAFMQEDGALRQVISGFIVGASYQIRYFENARNGGVPACEVKVGGNTIVATHLVTPVGGSNPYREVVSDSFVAAATSLELSFIKSNPQGGDTTLLIDNVSIVPPNTPPSITIQPQDVVVGLGDTATFSVAAAGSPPLTYQWFFNSDAIPGQNGPTLVVPTGFGDEAGEYHVVVANASGSINSRVAQLTLRAKVPGLFNTGVDDSGNALADGVVDAHYTLVVNADGPAPETFVQNSAAFPIVAGPWTANTAGAKWIGPRFDTSAAAGLAQGNGIYVYRTTFDLTGIDRSSVVITGGWAVDNNGVSIKVNGIATGLVNGNGFGGLTPFTINSLNASFVDGVNTLEFEVQNADAAAGYTGLYVGNLKGLAELPGTPPGITTQPQSQLAGTGETISLSVVASGSSPIAYQWRKNGNDIEGAQAAIYTIPSVAKTDAGTYSVYISNPVGNITSGDAVLTVRDTIPGLFNTGVDNSKAALPDGTADGHYQLIVNPDAASNIALVQDSTVFPIVTGPWVANNAGSKWIGPRLETSAAAGAEGDGGNYTYRTTIDLTGFDPTDVVIAGVWATDNAGGDIRINGQSTGQANTDQFVAFTPFTITSGFTAGINTIDFELNNSAIGYTGLRVDRIRALGTALPAGTAPFIVAQPQDVTAELGETVTFKAVANGSAPLEYQWFFGPDALPGETKATLSFAFDFPDLVGDYSVRISNPFGSLTTDIATLKLPFVNQAPSFTKGPDIVVSEANLPAAYPFPGWATDIRSGPPEEAPQGLTFLVTSDNPGLLSAAINPANGLLSVSVTPYSNGIANVTVVLQDDGGTDNGGVDSSAPQTFVIRVLAVNDCPVAGSGSFVTDEDQTVSIPASLITDPDGGTSLTFTVVDPPTHGQLEPLYVQSHSIPPGPPILFAINYHPEPNFHGTDTFTYRASDGLCLSEQAGTITITVRPINDVPTAHIAVSPVVTLDGLANRVVISANNSNACVTLDGSLSSDVEPGSLDFAWLLDAAPTPISTEPITGECLEIGLHTITLLVSDAEGAIGMASETIEVITAGEAVDLLIAQVNEANLDRKNKRPFTATLKAVVASFDRGNNTSGRNQLQAFENKVRAQIGQTHPGLASQWISLAQAISNAAAGQ